MILGVHGLVASSISGLDADYQAVLDYATTQGYTLPSASQQTLQNQLVVDLKAAGIWSKLDTFAVFATDGNSDFALIDWIRLSQYTAVNSPTFTADQGFSGNGTSAYIDTNFNLTTDAVNSSQNDIFTGVYLYSYVSSGAQTLFGAYDSSVTGGHHIIGNDRLRCNSSGSITAWTLQSGEYQSIRRNNSSNFDALTELTTANQVITSSTMINKSMYILARNGATAADNFANSTMKISNFINSSYLDDTEFGDYVTAFDSYMTSI